MLNVIARGVLSIYETINVPLFIQVTGDNNDIVIEDASRFQFDIGLLGLIAYLAIELCHKAISEITWLGIGFLSLAIGNFILALQTTPSFTQLYIGVYFLWGVGSPITTAVCVSALSKVLGTRQQGKWMGLLGSAASASRIILPMLPPAFTSFNPLFWLNVSLCIIGVFLLFLFDYAVKKEKAKFLSSTIVAPVDSTQSSLQSSE
ncbi:Major Facilitator Superfamily (MFS) [Thraustotheca clavata]|uniref:Major Facilitator Superfamily (MFS) n=1 Tax=Thraustotheca clavata TaxID=74557 RepID=A0A1V9Y8U8_9STRA|nr:Major Facilitator Superfamily (MFS) [Thraustotheca clavata]